MGREGAVSYSQKVRLNAGCVCCRKEIMLSKWKCDDSVRISLRWMGWDRCVKWGKAVARAAV